MRDVTESYRCWAEVDLNALRENLLQIRTLAGREKSILTVVKADAYGHGLRQTAAVLMQSGTDVFGVANLAEARAIRGVGEGWPILMLGACLPEEIDAAVRDNIMATVSTLDEARSFSASAAQQKRIASVHLKLDTGMTRLGAPPQSARVLVEAMTRLPALSVSGLFTHYACAEDDAAVTERQRRLFAEAVESLKDLQAPIRWIHASNSGGVLLEQDQVCNTVRPGLLVYGIVPPGERTAGHAASGSFRPALSWKCRLSLVKEISGGTGISYGHTCVSKNALRVGIVTAGYGDGYLRSASNRAQVLLGGKRCAVLGRVTMDQMIVDVSEVEDPKIGDEVALLGSQATEAITASELATWCDTIPWEILTNITYRVPRIYRGGHAA